LPADLVGHGSAALAVDGSAAPMLTTATGTG